MLRWYNRLHEVKETDEGKRVEVEHPKLVSCMIRSADGGTSLLHKITKPTAQILKEEEEDVKPLARCEEKKKELAKHWQCDLKVQGLQDKP